MPLPNTMSYLTSTEMAIPILANSAQRYLKTKGMATMSISPPLRLFPNKLDDGRPTIISAVGFTLEVGFALFPWFSLALLSSSSATDLHTRQYSPVDRLANDATEALGPIKTSPRLTSSYPSEIRLPHVRQTQAVE